MEKLHLKSTFLRNFEKEEFESDYEEDVDFLEEMFEDEDI